MDFSMNARGMSSAGINAINSGPLIMRVDPSSVNNNTYIVGKYDFPVSSNFVLITSSDGVLSPTNAPYISTMSGSSINTNYANVTSTLTARNIGFSTMTGSTINANFMTVNSTLTGSTITGINIEFSTILGSSLVTNFATVNSTLTGSSIVTRDLRFSSIVGSSIVTNFATVNSTLYASTFITQNLTLSTLMSNSISTNFGLVNSTLVGSTITASTLSCSTLTNVSTINGSAYIYVSSGTCYSDYLFWSGSNWGVGTTEVHIGCNAGSTFQSNNGIAIGNSAGQASQGQNAVAVGRQSGNAAQSENSIAIGRAAGRQSQGIGAIAIGAYAGQSSQHASSIVINALNDTLNTLTQAALYIAPIRNQDSMSTLYYSTGTNEVTYGSNYWNTNGSGILYNNLNYSSIGINTSGPAFALDVNGQQRITSSMAGSTTRLILGGDAANTTFLAYSCAIESQWGINAASNMAFYTHDTLFGVPMVERMRILYNGSVGIGTSSPQYKLDVAGNTNVLGIMFISTSAANGAIRLFGDSNTSYIQSGSTFGMGSANKLKFTNMSYTISPAPLTVDMVNSHVGVGEENPTERLVVKDNILIKGDSNASSRLWLGPSPGNGNYDYCALIESVNTAASNYSADLRFYTHQNVSGGVSERMRITGEGNVGIGPTNPYIQLHVAADQTGLTGIAANSSDVNTIIGAYNGTGLSNAGSIQTTSGNGSFNSYTLALNPRGGTIVLGSTTQTVISRSQLSCSSIVDVSSINGIGCPSGVIPSQTTYVATQQVTINISAGVQTTNIGASITVPRTGLYILTGSFNYDGSAGQGITFGSADFLSIKLNAATSVSVNITLANYLSTNDRTTTNTIVVPLTAGVSYQPQAICYNISGVSVITGSPLYYGAYALTALC
jgi:hypothetical protein